MHNEFYIFYKRVSNLIIKSSKYIVIVSILTIFISSYNIISLNNFNKFLFSSDKINDKNTKVCICTLGKRENMYIKEFADHYKALGIDKIFLYDNNDIDDESFENVLSEYIKDGFIEIFNYRGKVHPQLKIYEDCYNKNKKIYDWFIFFDTDEFIHLDNYWNIKDFLNEKKF